MKNFNALNILFFYSSFFILSCNEKTDNKSQYYHENQNLKILLSDPVETLDPLKIVYSSDWEVANNIFEGLVAIDFNGKIQNVLVDTILIINNNSTYYFKLKSNVYFQDSPCFESGKGRRLTSHDINYTFERLAEKDYKFSNWHLISDKIIGIEEFRSKLNNKIKGIEIIDSVHLKINLKHPFSSFLKILANPNFYIVPHEAIEYFGKNFEQNPIGTGPFRISEYNRYEKIILVKNENYHQFDENKNRLPYLNTIEYRTIDQTENRISELVRKNINLVAISDDEFLNLIKDRFFINDFNITKGNEGLGVRYWTFFFDGRDNIEYKKLRKLIVSEFNSLYSLKNTQSSERAFTLAPMKFLSGRKKNHNNSFNNLERNINNKDTLTLMANMDYDELIELESICRKLNVPSRRIVNPVNYYGEISKVKPNLFRVSMTPSFPDAIEYYSLFYSANIDGVNLGNFSNKNYDKIYKELLLENNFQNQQILYDKLEQILIDEAAAIYLKHFGSTYYIYSKNLKQLKLNFLMPVYTNAYFE